MQCSKSVTLWWMHFECILCFWPIVAGATFQWWRVPFPVLMLGLFRTEYLAGGLCQTDEGTSAPRGHPPCHAKNIHNGQHHTKSPENQTHDCFVRQECYPWHSIHINSSLLFPMGRGSEEMGFSPGKHQHLQDILREELCLKSAVLCCATRGQPSADLSSSSTSRVFVGSNKRF